MGFSYQSVKVVREEVGYGDVDRMGLCVDGYELAGSVVSVS
jgi:hypothetical protein